MVVRKNLHEPPYWHLIELFLLHDVTLLCFYVLLAMTLVFGEVPRYQRDRF